MKKRIKTLNSLTVVAALVYSSSALAHVNVAADSSFAAGENPREYVEGSRAYIDLNLPEDCANEDRTERFQIHSSVVILPSAESLPADDFYTTGHGSDEKFGANAMMGSKPRASSNWTTVGLDRGPVAAYGSRGRTEDTRALKWLGGYLNTSSTYDNNEFVTKLPKISASSCVTKVRVEIPTITYCEGGNTRAWIGTAGSTFQDAPGVVVEEEYEPYFYIVRSKDNPLGDACGEGTELTVRPTDEDIGKYGGAWIQSPTGLYKH